MYTSCQNCNATTSTANIICPVCHYNPGAPGSALVRFSEGAKEASDGLGGLLAILRAEGEKTRFLAKCTGGIFALDTSGDVLWSEDWGHISTLQIRGKMLEVNGVTVDLDSGETLAKGKPP